MAVLGSLRDPSAGLARHHAREIHPHVEILGAGLWAEGFEGFRRLGSKALGLEFWALEVVGVLGSWGGVRGVHVGPGGRLDAPGLRECLGLLSDGDADKKHT